MGVDPKMGALAKAAPNFGYLLSHEPLLVSYGAAAEAAVYTDPNTAMVKCRPVRGGADRAGRSCQFGIPRMPDKQFQRPQDPQRPGLRHRLACTRWFDGVRQDRQPGHPRRTTPRSATRCFSSVPATSWGRGSTRRSPAIATRHRSSRRTTRHGPPQSGTSPELRRATRPVSVELIEMKASVAEYQTQAEARAQAAADAAVRQAVESQAGHAPKLVDRARQQGRRPAAAADDSRRERCSDRRRPCATSTSSRPSVASRPRLTEAQTRRVIDRMLAAAGWVVQDRPIPTSTPRGAVAVGRSPPSAGAPTTCCIVDAKLVGAIEAKREGTSLGGVDAPDGWVRGRARRRAATRRLADAAAVPVRVDGRTDTSVHQHARPRRPPARVFSFHRPETIARWMRARTTDPRRQRCARGSAATCRG